jgi:beta-lactamase regulating signal transducer with metallopeptidase domain
MMPSPGMALFGAVATSVAVTLLIWSLKSAVLLIIAALVTHVWRRGSASRRHAVWCTAVCATLAIPLFAGTLPSWHVLPGIDWAAIGPFEPAGLVVTPRTQLAPLDQPAIATTPSGSPPVGADVTNEPRDSSAGQPGNDEGYFNNQTSNVVTVSAGPLMPVASETAVMPWIRLALAVWVMGAVMLSGRVVLSWLALRRLRRHSLQVASGPGHELFESLCRRMGIRRTVRLLVGTRNEVPMAWGTLRPYVYLPKTAKTWGKTRLTAVLMHELGHLRRRDPLTQWITQLACAIQWMNPLVWYAAWRIRVEREQACDDVVVVNGLDVTDYAEQLLRVVASLDPRRVACAASLSMATPGHLEWRVHALLNQETNRKPANSRVLFVIAALGFSLAVPLAVLQGAGGDGLAAAILETAGESASQQQGNPVRLSYVDDTAEGYQSIAGSGHAVLFRRPNDDPYLRAIEIFASRYGYPQPPAEDFHVYILDKSQKLLHAFPFPYAAIERGDQRWYTLKLPATRVPKQFYVALAFNPHRTKGVYLGMDENAKTPHSYTGRPTTGYELLEENAGWMVRAVLAPDSVSRDPFADSE